MQLSTIEGLVDLTLNKVSKKSWTTTLDTLINTIHQVERDLKHIPGKQKKQIVMQTLKNLQTTDIITLLPLKDRQKFNQMIECMDESIDLLVAAMNSKTFKTFKNSCLVRFHKN